TDCRVLWPPDVSDKGCDCTVCVTAEAHNAGTQTLHWAIDQVKDRGGTVCLGTVSYDLGENAIRIAGARSVRLKGQGRNTRLRYKGPGAEVLVEDSRGVQLEDSFVENRGASPDETGYGVLLRNSAEVTLRRCGIEVGGRGPAGGAVGLGGYLIGAAVQENQLFAATGVGR